MQHTSQKEGFYDLIDQLALPMCIFESTGRILKANSAFNALIQIPENTKFPNLFRLLSLLEDEMYPPPPKTKMLFDKVARINENTSLKIDILLGKLADENVFYATLTDLTQREKYQKSTKQASQMDQLLTPREKTVIKHLSKGLSNKNIAKKMILSEGTIKVHLRSIMKKLSVKNRTQLAIYAHENQRA